MNQLIERDDHTPGASGTSLDRRLYAEQDADYNVTSLTNSSGTVVERYIYDPYGSVTVLNASGTVLGAGMISSTVGWNYGFQDGWTDPKTGQVYFDNRWVNVILGRWDQQDPAGTINGANLYQLELSGPVGRLDPSGTQSWYQGWGSAAWVLVGGYGGDAAGNAWLLR